MYTKLNIYIKQMTSSECPLGRDFIEVASGWVGKAVRPGGGGIIMMKSLEFSLLEKWFPILNKVCS